MILGMTNTAIDISGGKLKIGDNLIVKFQNLFSNDLNFMRSLGNSVMIAVVTTVFALLISSMAGYGFEIYKSKRKEKVFNILLLSMMVPFAALMIPLYRMFSQLNGTVLGINSFLVVILASVSTAFLIFFFRQNAKSFPKDLVEAARLDGLKELSIFFRVYLPTAKNTYAAAAIITFMSSWNNYLYFGCFAITRQTYSSVSIVSNGCFLYTRLRHDHGWASDCNVTDCYRILCFTKAVRAG